MGLRLRVEPMRPKVGAAERGFVAFTRLRGSIDTRSVLQTSDRIKRRTSDDTMKPAGYET